MCEHSGGAPKVAFLSVDSWSEEKFEITPICEASPPKDRLSDVIREVEEDGRDPEAFLLQLLQPSIRELIAAALRRGFSLVTTSRKPSLAVDQITWITGMSLMEGETIGRLAKKHGISKQAFQQGAEGFRKLLEVKSQSRRPESMRKKMRMSNYRRSAGAMARA